MPTLVQFIDYLPFFVTVVMAVYVCQEGEWNMLFRDLVYTALISVVIASILTFVLCCTDVSHFFPSRNINKIKLDANIGQKDVSIDTFTVFAAYSILQLAEAHGIFESSGQRIARAGGLLFIHTFIVIAIYENTIKTIRQAHQILNNS